MLDSTMIDIETNVLFFITFLFLLHCPYLILSHLIVAHSFNQLDLPAYSSYEQMKEKLITAIREGSTGFGFR